MSTLVPTVTRGRSSNRGWYASSSCNRIASCSSGGTPSVGVEIDEDAKGPSPFDVAQELVAQSLAFARSFDEPGDVGDDELGGAVDADHAEMGFERGEGVVGDLGLGGRDHADERRLTGVRETDEGDVGHQLDLERQPVLLTDLTLLGEARRPPGVGEELGVPPPTPAAHGRRATGRRG